MKRMLVLWLVMGLLALGVTAFAEEITWEPLITGVEQLQAQHGRVMNDWPTDARVALVRLMRDAGVPLDSAAAEELLDTKISQVQQEQRVNALLGGDDPMLRLHDINGDGDDDLVVTTHLGASNTRHALWLWDGETGHYVAASLAGFPEGGLWGYQALPDGLLLDYQQEGVAAERWALYRWQGLTPVLLGRAHIEERDGMVTETIAPPDKRVTQEVVSAEVYADAAFAEQAAQRRQAVIDRLLALVNEQNVVLPDTLYYNPQGGSYWHADADCKTVKADYLPLTPFSSSAINEDAVKHLSPCPICAP